MGGPGAIRLLGWMLAVEGRGGVGGARRGAVGAWGGQAGWCARGCTSAAFLEIDWAEIGGLLCVGLLLLLLLKRRLWLLLTILLMGVGVPRSELATVRGRGTAIPSR